ncbi:MAG: succinate--CoA ligase subunit alpha [Omnitrophica bacterium RIFCSPLOWO2_12_FULL_44_17]|uniref:Succinate--CoA ligase [ADP-forming] subunit alpha n=1 Tax=Candidatus Danuiimicrobium aquiferis TaxID=1801832 RepID=A0A1G1L2H8_9BACT|nr:MAG: succinate--CoA ligase subunit alpha [Omnitrophica bacterium RIFCSPHIGHO2_02_FULL_45_28]OGW99328.1 MAG: succinate--CoA ligase subunit alpha [Omnitrophica bacterium RIFCSPLOWO2_12_FULL_44_17]OGX02471.1 MAG: succinate--CoA ligase subunit alpha [Omnitrophica bacterium RIFCSPLOWO2_02_FULL_44_11]
MGILADRDTKVIVQGMTGREGSFHTEQMLVYGTKVVGGVTPGKKGESVCGVPVFNTVKEAVSETQATASVIFVPARFAKEAICEAVEGGIKLILCITEGVPVQDMIYVIHVVKSKGVRLIGPNCPGIATAGETKLGIIPGSIFLRGNVGLASRSGTLTYEIVNGLTQAGLGQSTCAGLGGDPIIGTQFIDILPLFERDPQTEVIILIGEIGGTAEEEAAFYIKKMSKPIIGFISGRTAPRGKRMGHAGAIISGGQGTAESKVKAWQESGVFVAETTNEIPLLVKEALKKANHSKEVRK